MNKKNKELKEIEGASDNIRAFVDLKAQGPAKGGLFIRSKLKETVEKIEKDGDVSVVGVIYDGTYNLEILTQTKEERETAFNMALQLNKDV